MGLDNREYARKGFSSDQGGWGASSGSRGGSIHDWEVWKKLIAINAVVFLLQIFISRPATLEDYQESPYFNPGMAPEYDPGVPSAVAVPNVAVPNEAGEETIQTPSSNPLDQIPPEYRDDIQLYMPRVSLIQEWFELDSAKVLHGQIWRLFTCGFCHDRMGIWHLLFNMLFLYWFGSRLEHKYGSKEFTAFYFAALLTSSLTYVAMDLYTGDGMPAIGASGAVWGVTALYALLYPYERIHVYFLFPIEIRFLAIVYFVFDLHPLLLALSGESHYSDGVAHAAHVGGAVFGFMYWKQRWELTPLVDRVQERLRSWLWRLRNRDREMVLQMPSRPRSRSRKSVNMEEKMDAILEKVTREGRDALTDRELEILEQASRQLRQERNRQD